MTPIRQNEQRWDMAKSFRFTEIPKDLKCCSHSTKLPIPVKVLPDYGSFAKAISIHLLPMKI